MKEFTRVDIKEGAEYTLRMPASEAMIACRKHGELQPLRVKSYTREWGKGWNVQFRGRDGRWYDSGYTYSECGLYRDGDSLYGYLPDLSDDPQEFKRQTAEVALKLRAAFVGNFDLSDKEETE